MGNILFDALKLSLLKLSVSTGALILTGILLGILEHRANFISRVFSA
jgi:hypothetical protein